MNHHDALLDRYLLGRTSPEETEAVELRLLEDAGTFESAEAAEFELLERYARGELDDDDRSALATRLEGSPRLRGNLTFAQSLIEFARTAPRIRKSWLASLLAGMFAPAARPAWAAAALASIGAVWLGSQNVDLRQDLEAAAGFEERVSTLEQVSQKAQTELARALEEGRRAVDSEARLRADFARSQQRATELESRIARQGNFHPVTLSLTATTRSGGGASSLVLDAAKTHVLIELDLPANGSSGPWTATVERESVVIWTEADLSVERSSLGVIGSFELPRQSLVEGRYDVVVRAGSTTIATFPLTVERP